MSTAHFSKRPPQRPALRHLQMHPRRPRVPTMCRRLRGLVHVPPQRPALRHLQMHPRRPRVPNMCRRLRGLVHVPPQRPALHHLQLQPRRPRVPTLCRRRPREPQWLVHGCRRHTCLRLARHFAPRLPPPPLPAQPQRPHCRRQARPYTRHLRRRHRRGRAKHSPFRGGRPGRRVHQDWPVQPLTRCMHKSFRMDWAVMPLSARRVYRPNGRLT